MTQLIIADVEVVLPQNFSVTVKRENSFFTKSGEYTYDCTLRLDNPVNCTLWGFLNRVNKSGQLRTDRTALLIADGHVYCRGKEIVTRWTEDTVSIQIVGGESEMNYFIGQDRKIEDLGLGDVQYVYPVVRTSAGGLMNYKRLYKYTNIFDGGILDLPSVRKREFIGGSYDPVIPSPMLCPLLNRIISALGYTVSYNQLDETMFSRLFILNCRNTQIASEMLPGWTVKDFLTEVEKLTGCVFITDNTDPANKTCKIMLKGSYYHHARLIPLQDVVDEYETNVDDDDSREAEFTTSDVSYDLPNHRWSRLMKLPDGLPSDMTTYYYPGLNAIESAAQNINTAKPVMLCDTTTGRKYVCSQYTTIDTENKETVHKCLREVDQFADLDRSGTTSTLELKITPAPMAYLGWPQGIEVIDLGTTNGFDGHAIGWKEEQLKRDGEEWPSDAEEWEVSEGDVIEQKDTFEDTIRAATKKESQAGDLYCAFIGGSYGGIPVVYTDFYHATEQYRLNNTYTGDIAVPGSGSLRLQDIEDQCYQGAYEIDTMHAVTFETFDPNVCDPRQVYVIRNRRYVVRDVEEVITAEGRQQKWKLTCYPIHLSDESAEHLWVLSDGTWDDGKAWLDDGRWIDNPVEN